MSAKKFYIYDPCLVGYVGRSTDTKPSNADADTNIPFGSLYLETDTNLLYVFGSTDGWCQWRNFST